ncbi:flagellar hook-associated protein FlgL [Lysinibacillus sp. NPDC096418]|uniref:flagellar hook-associated protein FlgL n=1 Tax=Lysinibacillus sp. NPDC096418 TaxID=3364138 RepID=UPI0037FC6E9A
MRVTQSMLSGNMLRNLNNSYGRMSDLQNQLASGTKINRPSDDPVIAVKGMGYRRDLGRVEQYTRNMNTVNTWLDTSNESLDQVSSALTRVKELIIQAANDTNTADERKKINTEIEQIKQQLQDIGNTQVAGDYIFSGTKTDNPLFSNGALNAANVNGEEVKIEISSGIQLTVNTDGTEVFKMIDDFMTQVSGLLNGGATSEEISSALGATFSGAGGATIPGLDAATEKVLEKLADIGARQNRVETMENRLAIQFVSVNKQISDNEDVDYAQTITEMITNQSIHQAGLSVGAKIIQQTLVDFIR